MQHLLRKAVWDADAVRDDVRDLALEQLGKTEAILAVEETGNLKKGRHTVGVQRQYTGTAGRVENAQVSVFLTYSTAQGHMPIVVPLESWRVLLCGFPVGSRRGVLVVDRAHHCC